MPLIELLTEINAPIERCFDLSLSIDFHMASTRQSHERAVAGVMSGLIGLDETVTWKARHFGIWFSLTSQIIEFRRPEYFKDQMVDGPFKSMVHTHIFERKGEQTLMTDVFDYGSPFGLLGKAADGLILKKYMTALLKTRNRLLKDAAESEAWTAYLLQG